MLSELPPEQAGIPKQGNGNETAFGGQMISPVLTLPFALCAAREAIPWQFHAAMFCAWPPARPVSRSPPASRGPRRFPHARLPLLYRFRAGGPTDTLGRILADRMKTALGQAVI